MKILHWIGVFALAGLLSACVSDIQRVQSVQATGSAFTQALTKEYQALSKEEVDEYDWNDARLFARKGLSAAAGENVAPLDPANYRLGDAAGDIGAGHQKLVGLLDAGARDKAPEAAARAQGRFDCWVHEQWEGLEADEIAACKDQFAAAIAEVEKAMGGAMAPMNDVVYFDFNKSNLRADAQGVLNSVIAEAKKSGGSVSVTGYTDLVGSDAYNLRLSEKRADAVRTALINGGVAADKITVAGKGKADPVVNNPGPEQRNRRVEIIVQ
jgi:OmpA-OmpF porin, OOP family